MENGKLCFKQHPVGGLYLRWLITVITSDGQAASYHDGKFNALGDVRAALDVLGR